MATTFLAPGIYIEETDRGPRPIQGVETAVTALIGFAETGPVNQPTLVTNWAQYTEIFGGYLPGALLPYAVNGYFENGGDRCYVLRLPTTVSESPTHLVRPLANVELPARAAGLGPSLLISSRWEGSAGEAIEVEVRPAAGANFTLIARLGEEAEIFENLTLGRGEQTIETVNQQSALVQVQVLESSADPAERIPVMGTYRLALSRKMELLRPQVNARTFIGDIQARQGIDGLEIIEEITLVAAPDLMGAYQTGILDDRQLRAAQLGLIAHCESMGDRFALLDAPYGLTPQQVARWRRETAGYDSKYAALYYPWLELTGMDGRPLLMPPSGHVAGIISRVDAERGVHKAPGNELVKGALALEIEVGREEQDLLNPLGVNCIRQFPGRGIRVFGARTLSSDPAWRYVNVRRLFNFVEESIREGTQWVVYEPNDHYLWGQVKRDVNAFLRTLWRKGALLGDAPDQAFYVKCDEELNPPEVRDEGQLIIEIGLAPVKPAEFIVFRISQWAGGGA